MAKTKHHVFGLNDFFDRGRFLRGMACTLVISLCVMPAKAKPFDSEEGFTESLEQLSSPEAGPLGDSSLDSTLDFQAADAGTQHEPQFASPLLTEGIFPYQWDPISAVIAASLTLAFMSLKETGKIDIDGIKFLLNSTDLYAGLAGSVLNGGGAKIGVQMAAWLGKRAQAAAPEMLTPLAQKEAVKILGDVMKTITNTVSVSVGYEAASQFWKFATKNIPEAKTVTGFYQCDEAVKRKVLVNVMYAAFLDKNLQKKVLDSIYHYRILTFEFLAMNVGIIMGATLGNFIAKKYAPGNPWAKRLAPVVGSVGMGILFQMIPDSWKIGFNKKALDWKIRKNEERLRAALETLQNGIRSMTYPSESMKGITSYWMSGVDLEEDLDRVFRARDMLASLKMQNAFIQQNSMVPLSEALEIYGDVADLLDSERERLKSPDANLSAQIDQWMREQKSPEEIQRLSIRAFNANPKRNYYYIFLDEAAERARENEKEHEELQFLIDKSEEANQD